MDFSSKLNFLMNITQTSNKELAKSIYVDPSLISHLKIWKQKKAAQLSAYREYG